MACNYERSENRKGNPSGHCNRQGFLMRYPKHRKQSKHKQTGECKTEKNPLAQERILKDKRQRQDERKYLKIICLIKGEHSEYLRGSKTELETE